MQDIELQRIITMVCDELHQKRELITKRKVCAILLNEYDYVANLCRVSNYINQWRLSCLNLHENTQHYRTNNSEVIRLQDLAHKATKKLIAIKQKMRDEKAKFKQERSEIIKELRKLLS